MGDGKPCFLFVFFKTMVYNNLALILCRFERAKLQKNPFRMEVVFKKNKFPPPYPCFSHFFLFLCRSNEMETMESPNQPTTIMNNSLIPLSHAVQIIKTAILQSQEQSAKKVNADLLALYYAIGGYISKELRRQQWGSGAILAISEQLQKELPGLKGFGESSIKNMRQFYEQWCEYIIRQPLAGELQQPDLQVTFTQIRSDDKSEQTK